MQSLPLYTYYPSQIAIMSEHKIYQFWAVVQTGFEEVALDEMSQLLPEFSLDRREKGRAQTRLYFTYHRSPLRLRELRSVQAVYALLADMRGITVGKPGLERIKEQIGKTSLAAARHLAGVFDRDVDAQRFHLNVTMQGHHRFSVADMVHHVQAALGAHHGLKPGESQVSMHLQFQVRGRSAVLGMKLVGDRVRAQESVAFCLGQMVGLEEGDCVLWLRRDTAEVAELVRSFGVEVIAGAMIERAPRAGVGGGAWFRWDGFHLPVLEEECSHVMAHCRTGSEGAFVEELARILPLGGIALVETERREVLSPLVAAVDILNIAAVLPVSSRGRQHHLFAIERVIDEELLQVQLI